MIRTVCWGLLVASWLWVLFFAGLWLCNLLADRLPSRLIDRIDRHLSGEDRA